MKRLTSSILLSLAAAIATTDSNRAKPAAVDHASERCRELVNADFSKTPDAPLRITGSTAIGSTGDEVGRCHVTGYVAPNVGFLLRLPINNWNGKLLQLGCGGFCGTTTGIAAGTGDYMCKNSVRRGYACIVSDNGHTGGDGLWAYNNLQAEIDHAYRGAHVTALAGKAIVERYYRQPPKRSYFWGCSTGGRQALMEAQRFPWDFDGIIAGDPSLGVPELHMALLWAARALEEVSGKSIFERSDLLTLHGAVIAKCDLNDGVKDGLIGDPRACTFEPAELLCVGEKGKGCLTAKQIEAAERIYSGPVTVQGKPIYTSVALKGSELTWGNFSSGSAFANEEFRYSGFDPDPGPTWESADFDFDRDYKRLGVAKALYSAVNPDLREFKAAGGKLLAYQGWATHVPLHIIDYYETAERTMGGGGATRDFFRLFVIPGMNHCTGGEGAFAVDWLSYLEAWVEHGQAPERIIGYHVSLSEPLDPTQPRFPLDLTAVEFSRPVYPYPRQVKYRGRGDPKKHENFVPIDALPEIGSPIADPVR